MKLQNPLHLLFFSYLMRKFLLTTLLIWSSFYSGAQEIKWGYSVGLAFSFGTEVNRLGIHAAAYLNSGFVQLNAATNGYYNFRSLGLKKRTLEIQSGLGLQLAFGRKDTVQNRFIGLTENNTTQKYAAGFAFLQYWDRQGTTQSTGIINLNTNNWNFVTENDLFGNLIDQTDRFRTGAFLIEYQYLNTKIGINALLWTHDYAGCPVINNDQTKKWARFGYYRDEDVVNRSHSLGLLSVQVKQWLPYNQQAEISLGVNSEKVRNAFQNEFIHDQPFFPPKMVKRKPAHIPMMTIENGQYLHQEDQKIRPATCYFNIGLNTLSFY